jgi:capsular polysaccharide biosynthesis protein
VTLYGETSSPATPRGRDHDDFEPRERAQRGLASRLPLHVGAEVFELTVPRGPMIKGEASIETTQVAVFAAESASAELWPEPASMRPRPRPRQRGESTMKPLDILRERWLVAFATLVLTTAVVAAAGQILPQTYDATATVALATTTTSSSVYASLLSADAATEAVQARAISLADRVAALLDDGYTGHELLDMLVVATPMEANVLRFTVSASSAVEAAEVANLYAKTYLAERKDIYDASVETLSQDLTNQIDVLNPETDQALIYQLTLERAGLPMAFYPGRISNEATPASASSLPGTLSFVAAGVAAGVILGVFAAILADRVDSRVRNRRRLEEIFPDDATPIQPKDLAEAPHRVLVMLRSMVGYRTISRVAVLSVGKRHADMSVEELRLQLEVEADRPNGISGGLPIYWIDARGTRSRARQLEVAAAADVTVLVVGHRDQRGSVRDIVEALEHVSRNGVILCLFLGAARGGVA